MIHKFKIGDRVKCIGKSSGRLDYESTYAGAGWKKHFEFTITYIQRGHERKGDICSEGNDGVFEKWLEGIGLKYLIKKAIERVEKQ